MDGISHISAQPERQPSRALLVSQWRQVGLELQLARQRLECQQSVRGSCNSLHFSPVRFPSIDGADLGEFCFAF